MVPPFAGLRRFRQGRRFKQWTGDDSKALMKAWFTLPVIGMMIHFDSLIIQVYISAIEGYVPGGVVRTLRAFLEFCYIVRRNTIDTQSLHDLEDALRRFHTYRKIFETSGVRKENRHPPRQHSLLHYPKLIRDFGAPNGLCSSITESKHIKAIKEPWRRSNRYNALGQMLQTNQRLDKLAASRVNFEERGMLKGNILNALLPENRESASCLFHDHSHHASQLPNPRRLP